MRDFGLVGRVAGKELAALDERIDYNGAVVAVAARTEEAGVVGRVLLARRFEVGDDFALALLAGYVMIAFEAVLGGYDG